MRDVFGSTATCVPIAALVVDAHGVLAQQERHHLQVFAVGAGTERTDTGTDCHIIIYSDHEKKR